MKHRYWHNTKWMWILQYEKSEMSRCNSECRVCLVSIQQNLKQQKVVITLQLQVLTEGKSEWKILRMKRATKNSLPTISFHWDDLKITPKVPSIQAANRKPIPISSHCHRISCSKIRMLIQWVSGSTVEICKNFRKTTSWYSTSLIWNLQCHIAI